MHHDELQHGTNAPPAMLDPEMEKLAHYFFSGDAMPSLSAMLQTPIRHFIEDVLPPADVLDFNSEEHPHLSLSLCTRTAFRQPVADFFTALLLHTRAFSPLLASDIKTCVQEAVMNSIIHGNLSIRHDGNSTDHFERYLEKIAATINDETRCLKRISIFAWFTEHHITICVADEGEGFTLDQPALSIDIPYGRGLPLIRAMSDDVWQPKTNHLTMQFSAHG